MHRTILVRFLFFVSFVRLFIGNFVRCNNLTSAHIHIIMQPKELKERIEKTPQPMKERPTQRANQKKRMMKNMCELFLPCQKIVIARMSFYSGSHSILTGSHSLFLPVFYSFSISPILTIKIFSKQKKIATEKNSSVLTVTSITRDL